MPAELLINVSPGEVRIAERRNGKLSALRVEPLLGGGGRPLGDIILGRVSQVVPAMDAAFVEIGMERAGFLPLRDAKILAEGGKDELRISDCVREGDSVVVQVTREPFAQKGAQLSATIALPAHFLVMTPGKRSIAVSRRIDDEARREDLLRFGERLRASEFPDAGFIFRTAARDASSDELAADARALAQIWLGICKTRKNACPPVVLHSDLGPVERALRDMAAGDIAHILIDDAAALETARAYCRKAMPGLEARLALAPRDLFAREGLEDEIAALSSSQVTLPSGAWITIEPTQALTAVDVNSGSFTQSSGRPETSLAVNLEAAAEIGRQLRLREIGGLIVVDFIQLENGGQVERIVAALKDSLGSDVPFRISPMSEFGIVAITRQRRRAPSAATPCAACDGTGRVRTAAAEAQDILRRIEREAAGNPGAELVVTAAPPVADWFAARDAEVREVLIRRGAGRVRFERGERSDVRRA
jgi:ribonuclease G